LRQEGEKRGHFAHKSEPRERTSRQPREQLPAPATAEVGDRMILIGPVVQAYVCSSTMRAQRRRFGFGRVQFFPEAGHKRGERRILFVTVATLARPRYRRPGVEYDAGGDEFAFACAAGSFQSLSHHVGGCQARRGAASPVDQRRSGLATVIGSCRPKV